MDKKDYQKIINEYGESFYLLDSNKFLNNFQEMKESFSSIYSNFNIAYSYKTNYIPKLCKIVNDLGGYAEVVSEMELELALRIGVKYENIIWNGPIKNINVLQEFLLNGGIANIDNIEEYKYIRQLSQNNIDNKFRLGIRCNYDVKDDVISRFGFDVEGNDFSYVLNGIINSSNMNLVSLQCHFAKRNLEYWKSKVNGMISLIDKLNIIPEIIDVGGGMYGKMEDSLKKQFNTNIPTYDEYAAIIANAFASRFNSEKKKPLLLIEPGSALVGDCMQFVGTIKSIKNIRGKHYASVLASQKNISMSSVNPPIEIVHMGNKRSEYKNLDFVGFTCIESDVLYHDYSGSLAMGDLLVISNCGSYSIVMKPPFILPNFPVVDISNGKIELIKRRENFDDIFSSYEI